MRNIHGKYLGRAAFLIALAAAAVLLAYKPDLNFLGSTWRNATANVTETASAEAEQRIGDAHQAIRERLDAAQHEADRQEAQRLAELEANRKAAAEEAERARRHAAAQAAAIQAEARKAAHNAQVGAIVETDTASLAPPIDITPDANAMTANAMEKPAEKAADEPLQHGKKVLGEAFGKIFSAATKARDFIVDAVRLDRLKAPFSS